MKIRVNKIKGELLTKRPEKMDYETYRATRKAQEKQIKQRIRRGVYGMALEGSSRPVGRRGEAHTGSEQGYAGRQCSGVDIRLI